MQNHGKPVELLAPAGNPAAFYGAVKAGADAVYLGSQRFGARAYAENFTVEELLECIRYGHVMGCKLYLTVNTLMKEEELAELYDHIHPLYEGGLDGVIVQDFGALRLLRESFPGLKLHASTQMTLCSSFGAELLKSMGACRMVPARELCLEEIKAIRQKADIELETFIHGAMCYSYSGQCLFSSILGGRSGNRGRCAQPCRLPYCVETDGHRSREQYFLSLKDMCTLEHIPKLIQAGIDSFKIEGRMKKPEYAAGVTAIYRKYIDRCYELQEKYGAEEAEKRFLTEKADRRILTTLYIRSQVQDGYYFKKNGREMITLDSPAYGAGDESLLADINSRYLTGKKRLPLTLDAVFKEGKPVSVTAVLKRKPGFPRYEDGAPLTVTVTGEAAQRAANQPVTEENVRKQLGKLGDSPFFAEEILVDLDPGLFFPLKQINELRRQAVSRLEEALLSEYRAQNSLQVQNSYPKQNRCRTEDNPRTQGSPDLSFGEIASAGPPPEKGISVSVTTGEQLAGLLRWLKENPGHDIVCVCLSEKLAREGREACRALSAHCPLLITLPVIIREQDGPVLEELYSLCGPGKTFSGFLIRSADGLGFLEKKGKSALWYLDASFYIWNRTAAEQFAGKVDSFCLPLELNKAEGTRLAEQGLPFEKVVYGRIPMMITANCVLKTAEGCSPESSAETVLIDRYGKRFPVIRDCTRCTNIIYNSVPLSLHREFPKWRERIRCRLNFTVEDEIRTMEVLDVFLLSKEPKFKEYTTGHEKRGVL